METVYASNCCREGVQSKVAIAWCPECDKWLCTICEEIHTTSTKSSFHEAIKVQDYVSLPLSVSKLNNKCKEHGEVLVQFCLFHGTPCCLLCVHEKHKTCTLSPLKKVWDKIKSSAAVSHIERELKVMTDNFEDIQSHLNKRTSLLEEQKTRSIEKIHSFRKSLNDHLDLLENKLIDGLLLEQKKVKTKMVAVASQIQASKNRIANLKMDLSKLIQYATNFQTFIGLKDLEEKTSAISQHLVNVDREIKISETHFAITFSPILESLIAEVHSFGEITTQSSVLSSLDLHPIKQGRAQCAVPLEKSIEQIKLQKIKSLEIAKDALKTKLTGCATLPGLKCVFADFNNNRLLLYNGASGTLNSVIRVSSSPYDVTFIHDNIVAISVYRKRDAVIFVDVLKNKEIEAINIEGDIVSIDSNGEILTVGLGKEKAIIITDLDGTIVHRVNIQDKYLSRATFFNANIYYTSWKDNIVTCCNLEGRTMWTYKSENLHQPIGIAMDSNGFVYVANEKSDSVVVISSKGDKGKILNQVKYLNSPYAVRCDKENNLMLVCNTDNGMAFLYRLSYN